jgi:homoserine acetyltransferase
MDGLVPLASMPMALAGRNRMWRKMVIDAIRNDPEWMGGEYAKPPRGMVVEMIVKVLDACSLNAHKWVFAGGLTNVEVTLTVTDTQTGAVKTYLNPANTAFLPIQDTAAFGTCP